MSFQTVLETNFPNTSSEITFVARTYDWLNSLGFSAENSIACVGRCRDEITWPLLRTIQVTWGSAFDLASLGGLFNAGTTGLTAAIHHAPTLFGRQRYVIFAFPHIGINDKGEIGRCQRQGQSAESSACGALVTFQEELKQGQSDLSLNTMDIEQSLLKRRLTPLLDSTPPDLISLTKLALQATVEDIEEVIACTVQPENSDYALLTGIQIHGRNQQNFVYPATCYAVVSEKRYDLAF
jgi:hypothetical protein